MWSVMLRIEGAHVDAGVPGWLMNANATYAAIDQVKRAAHALAASPDDHGFDPDVIYTIWFQIWDRALMDVPSVAFGRNVAGQSSVGLLPDPYYMAFQGYRQLRQSAAELPDWTARTDLVAWRGSVTGDNTIAAPEDLPRIRLAMACRDMANVDVGLIGVHATMNHGRPPGLLDDFVTARRLVKERWDMADFGRHKFTIDIDGHANAWGFLEKLIVGCCVLKVDSPFEQWFYDRIRPWEHYVPVKADLSDLEATIAWCRENETRCRWIAENGARVAASLTLTRELPHIGATLLKAAHIRSRARPRRPTGRPASPARCVLEDALYQAENMGRIDDAIEARTHLIDAGMGGAMDLMKRHDLLRQRGDFAVAQSDMEQAVVLDLRNDEPPLRLGQFLASIGRHIAAIGYLEQAASRAPQREEIGIALAGSCLALNWLDRAYHAVRALPDDLPGWWADRRRQAIAAYRDCRDDVFAILRSRRSDDALTAERYQDLAVKLHALGRRRSASRLCMDAIGRDPDAPGPIALTADIAARWEGTDEALRYLSGDAQRAALADFKISALLFEQGRYHEVLDRIAVQQPVDDPRWQHIAAFSQIMTQRLPDLARLCRDWMAQSPDEMLPAEMVCAAQPVAAGPADTEMPDTALTMGQFWHHVDVPADVRMAMDSWSRHHPTLQRSLFDEDHARAFLHDEYGTEILQAFEQCRGPQMKSDYFRIAWLYRKGGFWVDADQRCVRGDDAGLRRAATSGFAAVRSGYITGYLENMFLAARAGSTQMMAALETATATIVQATRRGEQPWRWMAVGPGLLTRIGARSICNPDVTDTVLMTPMSYASHVVTEQRLDYKTSG